MGVSSFGRPMSTQALLLSPEGPVLIYLGSELRCWGLLLFSSHSHPNPEGILALLQYWLHNEI